MSHAHIFKCVLSSPLSQVTMFFKSKSLGKNVGEPKWPRKAHILEEMLGVKKLIEW